MSRSNGEQVPGWAGWANAILTEPASNHASPGAPSRMGHPISPKNRDATRVYCKVTDEYAVHEQGGAKDLVTANNKSGAGKDTCAAGL